MPLLYWQGLQSVPYSLANLLGWFSEYVSARALIYTQAVALVFYRAKLSLYELHRKAFWCVELPLLHCPHALRDLSVYIVQNSNLGFKDLWAQIFFRGLACKAQKVGILLSRFSFTVNPRILLLAAWVLSVLSAFYTPCKLVLQICLI